MSLIEEMRAKHQLIVAGESTLDGWLASSREFAELRKAFEKRTARIPRQDAPLTESKKRECSILLLFLLEHTHLPARRIALGEHPDFRFTVGNRRIGMELVEAFVSHPAKYGEKRRGSIRKEQEKIQDTIVKEAMHIHARNGGKPLRVHVSFGETDFRRADIAKLAAVIAALVPIDVDAQTFVHPTQSWLSLIQASPRPEFVRDSPCWDVSHGGSVWSAEDVLPTLIQSKEAKLAQYRKSRCDEYWLLIFIDGTAASSFIRLTDKRNLFASKFDQVFLFSPNASRGRRVLRLNVHGSSA